MTVSNSYFTKITYFYLCLITSGNLIMGSLAVFFVWDKDCYSLITFVYCVYSFIQLLLIAISLVICQLLVERDKMFLIICYFSDIIVECTY